jgi:GntR family transcriptional regulator, carbon starvation induced regulator
MVRTDPGRADGTTLMHQAYGLLREDILDGSLAAGSKLKIDALKHRYGIGPTPLREALSRLASDGLVGSEENRGFSIPGLSVAELRDITDQRKLVECTALRRAIEHMGEDYEARIVGAYHKLKRLDETLAEGDAGALARWEQRHRDFHRTLIEGAGSPWLSKFQVILYDQADRYRRRYFRSARLPAQVFIDHKEILEATLERDADRACGLLDRHIERVFDIASHSSVFSDGPAD